MLLNPFTFHAPKTAEEAAKLYSDLKNVKILAGGTFLLNTLKLLKAKGAKSPEHILSLQKIDELRGIEVSGDSINVKAMTTIDELFDSPQISGHLPIMKTVCRNISTQPIRNAATVGGNLTCRYTWTEMPAVMIGLGAKMHFIDANGKTSVLKAGDFYKQAAKTNKLLTHVEIPKNVSASRAYRRVRKSTSVDIPLLSLLIQTTFQEKKFTNTKVAINNCIDFAQRDKKLEEFLNFKGCSDDLGIEALDHLTGEIYDKRADDYKKHIFRVNLKSAVNELCASRK